MNFTVYDIKEKILENPSYARVYHWGIKDYKDILSLQQHLREACQKNNASDIWLMGEHLTVITQGVRGTENDLMINSSGKYPIFQIDRGGMTTIHTPGQLVIYPILRVQEGLLAQARLSLALLTTVQHWIQSMTGITLEILKGRPGLFFKERKAAAIGISIKKRVSMHGIAINLCPALDPWHAIIPCGEPETKPITLSEIAGRTITTTEFIEAAPEWIQSEWGYQQVEKVSTS